MVRSKTRPRILEETYPNGAPSVFLGPKHKIVSNNVAFNDHTGKLALMSWQSRGAKQPLPPLSSWVFYMVHPDVPRDFDGCAFLNGLEDDQGLECDLFRYEFFFLPGATAEECQAHYRGEVESRGTVWRQIRKIKRAMKLKKREGYGPRENNQREDHDSASDHDVTADGQLPGLILDNYKYNDCYSGWLFMYSDANVDCRGADGQTREIYLVQFDPIPEEWEDNEDKVGELDQMEDPIHSKRMKARDGGFAEGLVSWMYMTRKTSRWEEEAGEATGNALDLGWESW